MLVAGSVGSHRKKVKGERNNRKIKRIFRQRLERKSEGRTGRTR